MDGLTSVIEKIRKGVKELSSLPLTLINTVYYVPYLFFNFSVIFFKLRNTAYYAAYSAVCFDIKQFTYVVMVFASDAKKG